MTRNAVLRKIAIVASPRTTKVIARAAGCLVSRAMLPVRWRQLESDEEASEHICMNARSRWTVTNNGSVIRSHAYTH